MRPRWRCAWSEVVTVGGDLHDLLTTTEADARYCYTLARGDPALRGLLRLAIVALRAAVEATEEGGEDANV